MVRGENEIYCEQIMKQQSTREKELRLLQLLCPHFYIDGKGRMPVYFLISRLARLDTFVNLDEYFIVTTVASPRYPFCAPRNAEDLYVEEMIEMLLSVDILGVLL